MQVGRRKVVSAAVLVAVIGVGCKKNTPDSGGQVAAAQTMSFAGTWSSIFSGGQNQAGHAGNAPVTLTVTQVGNRVTGNYGPTPGGPSSPPGNITGVINGATIDGTWQDTTSSSGTFHLVLSADGNSFNGTWASGSLSGTWMGTRNAAP
jgi:hypothetical protein